MSEACCTCATLLQNVLPQYDEKTEKPISQDRKLECCGRVVCGNCISSNPRFATYCPYCQVSTAPNPLPQGLRDPPAYLPNSTLTPQLDPPSYADELPSYSSLPPISHAPPLEKAADTSTSTSTLSSPPQPAEDVLHFLDHSHDSLSSLSIRYNVPIAALRRANAITSDHLLLARRTLLIPGEFYKGGVSLSPRPIEGEEEELRKAKVRRFMVATKVSEYDVALLYLEQAEYKLEDAINAYKEDELWEREHPVHASVKGKGKTMHDLGKRRFTGQRS